MVRYIYLQHGSDVERVGARLQKSFNTYGKVRELVMAGDRSTITSKPYADSKAREPMYFEDFRYELEDGIEALYLFWPEDVTIETVEATDETYVDRDFDAASSPDPSSRLALSGEWMFRSDCFQALPCTCTVDDGDL
jgi:hypothetical protein